MRGVLDGTTVDRIEVIDNVSRIIHPYREWQTFLETAVEPDLNIVISNTTEAGIRYVPEAYFEDVCPVEFPAKLCRWLYARYSNLKPETTTFMLPCELIEDNGDRLRECVLAYADYWSLAPGFTEYVRSRCHFANTLVDRIVSGRPAADSDLYGQLDFADELLTAAEPYHLWAIEADEALQAAFPLDRTAFNTVFTDDLEKYRTLKVRILNGLHILMVLTGLPEGVATVADYVAHPKWGPWLQRVLHEEIIPALPYPAPECKAYAEQVMDRFRNPFLHHQLSDIALNTEEKVRVRLEPTMAAYRAKFGRGPALLEEVV